VMEGYGPGGAAILVQALTDNRNRTLQNVRNVFNKGGGSLGESGCVAWIFDLKGTVIAETDNRDADELALRAIDAGAEDVKPQDGYLEIYTAPEQLEEVRSALEAEDVKISSAEQGLIPKTSINLDERSALQTLKLMDRLEEIDEVQQVYTNADFTDEVLEKYQSS